MTDNHLSTLNIKSLENLVMDETNLKRSKRTSYLPINYFPSINLMQPIEISPLNPVNKPHPRSGHRAIATESDFWIWGGYHPSVDSQSQMFNEVN